MSLRTTIPSRARLVGHALLPLFVALLLLPAVAGTSPAEAASGGIATENTPRIKAVTCVQNCIAPRKATKGALVRINGGYLGQVRKVFFRGKKQNWVKTKWKTRKAGVINVVVPAGVAKGPLMVASRFGTRSNKSPQELAIGPVSAIPREVFPVRGPVRFGQGLGAGRGHQGQDLMAACGTNLVSARKGVVSHNKWQAAAGNYIVIRNTGTNTSFIYMHMPKRSHLKVGQKVNAGQKIGVVGTTGRSTACHLHFEYWKGEPWSGNRNLVNPTPYLRRLLNG